MKTTVKLLTAAAAIALAGTLPGLADERVSHYEPEKSETLAEAMENFVTYNRRMEEIIAHDPLTENDMEKVHELTYTLEVALARINEELGALPAVLEEVHLSSEGDNPARLKGVAEVYLEQAKLLDR